jgi:adenosylcobinamide-GDP ribazoletransferase
MSPPSFTLRDQAAAGLMFLTRLRLPVAADWPDDAVARAAWSFPLAGVVVGIAGALVAILAWRLGLPVFAAAVLALATTALVTGALHEDGLADTADGLGGGRTIERKLEIMKDSRVGSYGVLVLVLSVGLRASAIAALFEHGVWVVLGAMVAAHAASRAGLPAMMRFMTPARPGGLGASAGIPASSSVLAAAVSGALAALIGLGWERGMAAITVAAIAVVIVAMLARRQIGGYTGDILGAGQQVAEAAVLLVAAAV